MSLIVEDGSQVVGAESYASTTDADTYHAARGNTTWTICTTAQKEQALRRATDFMTQSYKLRWKGFRVRVSQALDWPRANVQIEDGPYKSVVALTAVPAEVKNACIEYAIKAAAGELAPDLTQQVLSESVGPLSVTYDKSSPQFARYRAIDMMLSPYLAASGVMSKVERS